MSPYGQVQGLGAPPPAVPARSRPPFRPVTCSRRRRLPAPAIPQPPAPPSPQHSIVPPPAPVSPLAAPRMRPAQRSPPPRPAPSAALPAKRACSGAVRRVTSTAHARPPSASETWGRGRVRRGGGWVGGRTHARCPCATHSMAERPRPLGRAAAPPSSESGRKSNLGFATAGPGSGGRGEWGGWVGG